MIYQLKNQVLMIKTESCTHRQIHILGWSFQAAGNISFQPMIKERSKYSMILYNMCSNQTKKQTKKKHNISWFSLRWHDILAEFPKALKATKPRRKQPLLILSNKENLQVSLIVSQSGLFHFFNRKCVCLGQLS